MTSDSVPVTVLTDDRHVLGYRPEIDAIISAIAPWRRFHYSYAANFTAIGLKALEHAMETSDADAEALLDRLFDRGPSEEGVDRALLGVRERRLVEGALDPLWFQSLYALRRRKSIHVPFLGSTPGGWDEGRRALLTPEGRSHPCWVGTGRYPVRSLHLNETFAVSSCMVRYRLVAARGDDLILSETGNRFLDALHPDCEDVDMPVRWAGRELVGADVKSMDAWITRTFRRMKTRVNEL